MTEHEDYEGLAAGYGLHALEPEDEQRLAAHLLTCNSCARLVAETAELGAAFAGSLAPEAPPQGLRARILEAAAAEPRSPSVPVASTAPEPTSAHPEGSGRTLSAPRARNGDSSRPGPSDRSRVRRMQLRSRVAIGALAAVVAVGVAVPVTLAASGGNKGSTTNSALAKWLTEPNAREVTLRGSGAAADTAVAKAVMTDKGILLVANGLPANDKAKTTYVLWAANTHGVRSSVTTFDVRNTSPVELTAGKLPFDMADVSQVAVSLEPGRQAPASPTDVVLSGTAA